MTKPKRTSKPKSKPLILNEAVISYKDRYGDEHTHTVSVPFKRHGVAEAILNKAEERGTPDLDAVREQLQRHYE